MAKAKLNQRRVELLLKLLDKAAAIQDKIAHEAPTFQGKLEEQYRLRQLQEARSTVRKQYWKYQGRESARMVG